MEPKLSLLFDRLQSASFKAKNRLVVAPMSRVSASISGNVTDVMSDYYEAFAQGGFGTIITEGVYTDLIASKAYPTQPELVSQQHMGRLEEDCGEGQEIRVEYFLPTDACWRLITST